MLIIYKDEVVKQLMNFYSLKMIIMNNLIYFIRWIFYFNETSAVNVMDLYSISLLPFK